MQTFKLPISVAIITFNEEDNLRRTLESISDIASEIIIVDSGSTDNTIGIAEEFQAKIFREDWKGHIKQKNSALIKCTQPWILSLDADEVVTEKLKSSIIENLNKNEHSGFYINRKTYYLGKLMNYAWQPDWKLRLVYNSSNPVWHGLDPHDELKINGTTKKLEGDLIHYSYKNIFHHFTKTIDYARISAKSYKQQDKKFSLFQLLFHPWFAFFKLYIIHGGFLDGIRGMIAGLSTFFGTFIKYAYLWELENNQEL
jgi:glycosyltransferase involved in cell wall biosynthesis